MKGENNGFGVSVGGVGFSGTLAIVFIVLKLLGVISWSWIWVLAPIWISIILSFVLFLIALILNAISEWL